VPEQNEWWRLSSLNSN